ncbi:peptidoglycan-binding protein [Polyangium aurulentum]|uniref:peptidoglycan-binding protein n=1 Tax=Polyangium aurulentum TaxID=2567896 RepID=UPI0010AEB060|nr:peptidoglycan-binding protein [Polyangium aurulentum]UQA58624.1 peptidoglycan-binding protein [Polyangium aurulentum]
MGEILQSVGQGGRNLRSDVTLVQTLLKAKGYDPGPVDGICGRGTIGAIRAFQATFMPRPDGLIEPGLGTWRRLSGPGGAAQTSTSPVLTDWSGDSSKWPHEKKVLSLYPDMRPKVEAVLEALKRRDFQPKIFFAWRSVAVQLELFRQGNTKVKFSFHNAQKRNGTPNAYAADIIDARYAWGSGAETSGFWKALGEEGKKQGLYWGGDWVDFRDWAHVQWYPNSKLRDVKAESGL